MHRRILIRCDAAPEIGFGHIVRCLALADELRDQHECEVSFAMLQGPQGVQQVQESGYLVHQPQADSSSLLDEGRWLQHLVSDTETKVLVLDIRTDLGVEAIRKIRAQGVLTVTIDDPSDRRLAADMAFYPPVPQVQRMDWSDFTGECFVGWDWVLLKPEFTKYQHPVAIQDTGKSWGKATPTPIKVLVTMGGSDPLGLTLQVLEALDQIEKRLHVIVILGRGFMHEVTLQRWLLTARRRYELRYDVQDMPTTMVEAHFAIASFGVTAYELAAIGLPAAYICLSEDHAESADAFVSANLGVNIGTYFDTDSERLRSLIEEALDRITSITEVPALIDGCGVRRVASQLLSRTCE